MAKMIGNVGIGAAVLTLVVLIVKFFFIYDFKVG